MNILSEAHTAPYCHAEDAGCEIVSHNREGLALILLDRITRAEGGEPQDGARAYTLDLLREILLTIDGKRTPPITYAGTDRRAGSSIERRAG
jgi:hypothetical protein